MVKSIRVGLWMALSLCVSGGSAIGAPMELLFFGNSFTKYDRLNDVPTLVKKVATAAGQEVPKVETVVNGGVTLGYHATTPANYGRISDPTNFTESNGFQWDHVVLQEFSTRPTLIGNGTGDIPGFRADAMALTDLVRDHSPAVVPVLFETWARHPAKVDFYQSAYGCVGPDPCYTGAATMQNELRTANQLARQDLSDPPGVAPARVALVGDAFEAGGWDGFYDNLYYHQNATGSLLAGLVIYESIYQDDPADLSYEAIGALLDLPAYGIDSAEEWNSLTALSHSVVPEPGVLGLGLVVGTISAVRRRR